MKKLILNIIYALIPLTFAVLLLAFPSRTASILFIMLSIFILYGSLKELYFILKVDMLSDRLRLISVIKNAINIILSVVVLFLSFSKPDVLMDVCGLHCAQEAWLLRHRCPGCHFKVRVRHSNVHVPLVHIQYFHQDCSDNNPDSLRTLHSHKHFLMEEEKR